MPRPKGSKNKSKKHPSDRPELLEKQIELNQLENPIKATLKILGKTFESKGSTVDEVLNGFKTPDWVKGAGVLIIENRGIIREKIIAGNHIRNLFGMASGTMREISLKWIKSLFT